MRDGVWNVPKVDGAPDQGEFRLWTFEDGKLKVNYLFTTEECPNSNHPVIEKCQLCGFLPEKLHENQLRRIDE